MANVSLAAISEVRDQAYGIRMFIETGLQGLDRGDVDRCRRFVRQRLTLALDVLTELDDALDVLETPEVAVRRRMDLEMILGQNDGGKGA